MIKMFIWSPANYTNAVRLLYNTFNEELLFNNYW